MLNCDVYLIHYEPLSDRLSYMKNQFERLGIVDYHVISSEPPSGWIVNDMNEILKKLRNFGNNVPSLMCRAEISLAWKHFQFMKRAAESKRPSLVLEDDAILSDNFVEKINEILQIYGWDVIFPGSGCNLRAKGNGLIQVPHPASKCTDSYIVTRDAAKKLSNSLSERIDLAIDWELNFQMMNHDLKVFWLEPPVVKQGSQDGTWESSIVSEKREK